MQYGHLYERDETGKPRLCLYHSSRTQLHRPFLPHHHIECELALIGSGSGIYTVLNKSYRFEKGDLFLFRGDELHCITEISPNEPFDVMNLHFEPSFVWSRKGLNSPLLWRLFTDRSPLFENRIAPENPQNPPMLCMLLRKKLCGATLRSVRQIGLDRIVFLDFDATNEIGDKVKLSLCVEIMAKYSNMILIDGNGVIVDSLKRVDSTKSSVREILPGLKYELPPSQGKLNLLDCDIKQAVERIKSQENKTLSGAVLSQIEGISPIVARELSALVTNGDGIVSELDSVCFTLLKGQLEKLKENTALLSESEKQEKRLRDAARARKRKRRIKTLITWIIILAIIAGLVFYYFVIKQKQEEKMKALQNQHKMIESTVKESVYTQVIDLSGYVVANDTLQAKFRSTGAVTGVFVSEGERVKKDQLLATIDNTSQQLALKQIENNIEEAKLTGSTRQLEILQLQKKNATNNLSYTELTANFDGVVASVDVHENDYFEAGDSVITIIDRSKLKATVEIDEIDMQYVYEGQKAILTFDGLGGKEIEAYVSYIPMLGRYTTQGIGVVDVELTIENPPDKLLPGYTFEGTIEVDGEISMLLVPSAAVTNSRGGVTTVKLKQADGSTKTQEVRVKYLGEGMCQVISGLSAGDVVTYEQTSSNMLNMMMPGGRR